MTIKEYQQLAARTIRKGAKSREMRMHALHGMVGEIGEIHSIFQKAYQGHPVNLIHLSREVGDLAWFMAELCTAYGWDMDYIFSQNIEKLKARYPDGFDAEKSMHRQEGDL